VMIAFGPLSGLYDTLISIESRIFPSSCFFPLVSI
jgi:hypothetical protein